MILAILLSWFICGILTWTDALTDDPDEWGYAARTDTRKSVLDNAKWFRFPYPCESANLLSLTKFYQLFNFVVFNT